MENFPLTGPYRNSIFVLKSLCPLLSRRLETCRANSLEDGTRIYNVASIIRSIRIIVTRKPELVDMYLQEDVVERLEQAVVAVGSSGSQLDEYWMKKLVFHARKTIVIVQMRRHILDLVA